MGLWVRVRELLFYITSSQIDREEETRLEVTWMCMKYLGPREIENNHNQKKQLQTLPLDIFTTVEYGHDRLNRGRKKTLKDSVDRG